MKKYLIFAFCLLLLVTSVWLMWHTLSYDSATRTILVGGKYWSDFGGHLPQIRSFSKGVNWPPQYPLFPGEPVRYHFLFYALVGLLEKAGLRLDFALNLPSALGFFSLLLMIFALAKRLFSRTSVAVLSVLFFLFNGSFSWLDYLNTHDYSLAGLRSLSVFPSFAPWNKSTIAAFWNLNIYTNQRHLGLSFALALAVLYIVYTSPRRLTYLVGFLIGTLLLLNQAAFAAAGLFAAWFFLLRPSARLPLFLSGVGFIPWLIFSSLFVRTSAHLAFQPGFLLSPPLTPLSFVTYWLSNIGLHFFLIPIGFLLSPRRTKSLILPLLVLFVLPNVFRLSSDMINNHKFFNFFLILGAMFSAHAVTKVKPLIIFIPLLVLGGIVDLFPVINDSFYRLSDYPANPDVRFFAEHTPRDAVVLNSTWFYHPASLAGRRIFNGYSYFTWSFGYDQVTREHQAVSVYRAPSKDEACTLLNQYSIDFVELARDPEKFVQPDLSLWHKAFSPVYSNPATGLTVYDVQANCP